MVVVTYDEFGGQWDHVSPPGQGNDNGPHYVWGPGTRIPALVLTPHLKGPFVVDHTQYDTTSILRFITRKFELPVLHGLIERDEGLRAHGESPMGDLTAALNLPR
jgi:phospholipase C